MKTLKLGVLGTGSLGKNHARIYSELAQAGMIEFAGIYDVLESYVRKGFFALDKKERQDGRDIMWYIWLHPGFTIVWKE